jgi:transcriptional regulator with XRE-family HTH domain
MQNVHIGKKIKARQEEQGLSVAEFARRLNRSSQSIYHIFSSSSIDTELLCDISKVLNFNFFTYWITKEENTDAKNVKKKRVSLLIDIDDIEQQKAVFKTLGITVK